MEQKGLRGSSAARIDDKGRLKVPTVFRSVIQDQHGPDVFVTSVTGKSVLIYPMPAWLEVERRLNAMAGTHPSKLKFLTRVNYWGQTGELDSQGRVLIPAQLRQSASIEGEVRVFVADGKRLVICRGAGLRQHHAPGSLERGRDRAEAR